MLILPVKLEASENTRYNKNSEDPKTHTSKEGYVGKKIDYVNTSVSTFFTDDQDLKVELATVSMMPAAPASSSIN